MGLIMGYIRSLDYAHNYQVWVSLLGILEELLDKRDLRPQQHWREVRCYPQALDPKPLNPKPHIDLKVRVPNHREGYIRDEEGLLRVYTGDLVFGM